MKIESLTLILLIAIALATNVVSNSAPAIIVYKGVTESIPSIFLPYGTDLVIQDSILEINGSVTGQGKNGCSIRNSTIYLVAGEPRLFSLNGGGKNITIIESRIISVGNYSSFSFAHANLSIENATFDGFGNAEKINHFWYNRKITMKNLTICNVGNTIQFTSTYDCLVQNLSFTNLKQDLRTLVFLNNIHNAVFDGVFYEYTKPMIKIKDASAFYIGNSNNITFNNLKCLGIYRNVNTPHHHIIAGRTSHNVTVKNGYFWGGGNGAEAGVTWLNCTFDGAVDGTEGCVMLPTYIADCVFCNIIGAEINLQSGLTWNFINCTFSDGIINLSNGTAVCTNCTFPSGMHIVEYGDNTGGKKYAGTVYQFWNFTHYAIGMKTTWKQNINTVLRPSEVYSGFNFTVTDGDKPLIMLTRTS